MIQVYIAQPMRQGILCPTPILEESPFCDRNWEDFQYTLRTLMEEDPNRYFLISTQEMEEGAYDAMPEFEGLDSPKKESDNESN